MLDAELIYAAVDDSTASTVCPGYAPPRLQTFGNIQSLTKRVGAHGKKDSTFSLRKTGF